MIAERNGRRDGRFLERGDEWLFSAELDPLEDRCRDRVLVEVTHDAFRQSKLGFAEAAQSFDLAHGRDEVGFTVALRNQRAIGFAHLRGEL